MRSYSVEKATRLVQLLATSAEFRLKAALFVQQVRHQNAEQVRATGAQQNLDLRETFTRVRHRTHRISEGPVSTAEIKQRNRLLKMAPETAHFLFRCRF